MAGTSGLYAGLMGGITVGLDRGGSEMSGFEVALGCAVVGSILGVVVLLGAVGLARRRRSRSAAVLAYVLTAIALSAPTLRIAHCVGVHGYPLSG